MTRRFQPLVLCYHAVSNNWPHGLAVPVAALEQQLRSILLRRYRPAHVADVIAGRGRLLHVTFDDAFCSVRNALPVLEALGVPATVFVSTAHAEHGTPLAVPELLGEVRKYRADLATLSWDDLRELADRGVEIGSHTVTHAHLSRLCDRDLERELRESRERVEAEFRRPCRYLAYPYGEHDARVRAAAKAAGYEAAFGLPGSSRPLDLFDLPRVGIWRKDGLLRMTIKTSIVGRAVPNFWRRLLTRGSGAESDPENSPDPANR